MTLAMAIAQRGGEVLVLERRAAGEPPTVKTNHISARSMEVFRRLGLADELRRHGLPPDHPHDCAYRVSVTGRELARTKLGSTAARMAGTDDGADSWWPTAEPPHRINQTFVEPVLNAAARATDGLELRHQHEVSDVRQRSDKAVVLARDLTTGYRHEFEARYVVGCDGPRSAVRRRLGVELEGPPAVGRVQSTLIRAPELLERVPHRRAWAVVTFDPAQQGAMFSIDGRERFLIHNALHADQDYLEVDREAVIRRVIGDDDIEFEILSIEDYTGRGLVAGAFRDRRVFLAGDAAHLWMPFAGYGMNAGIADAVDLAWLLVGRLEDWLSDAALDAYEAERRPVTTQVMRYAMGFLPDLFALNAQVPPEIDDATSAGEHARAEYGAKIKALNEAQYAAGGLNFGYFYDASPLIAYDGEQPPAYDMASFTPSTVPGCRAPHAWLSKERSLWDELGPGYTLVRTDRSLNSDALHKAMAGAGIPFVTIDLDGDAATAYDRPLVVIRPDQHVAWRGYEMPEDPVRLTALLTGLTAPIS